MSGVALSATRLWEAQRAWFARQGVDAWSSHTVPHYVTNNPRLAYAYARLIAAFARDCGAAPEILELGAGSGRFAFYLLRALAELGLSRVRYLVTDAAASNLEFVRAHPALRSHVASGVLRFAHFDAERDARPVAGPLVAIANYVFDGISHDAFSIRDGQLHEELARVEYPESHPGARDFFERTRVDYESRPVRADYYGDPDLDALLRQEKSEGPFFFPVGPVRCIRRLADSPSPTLVLCGDRSDAHETRPEQLALAVHGSFSLPVHFRALARFVTARGGVALESRHAHGGLAVAGYLFGGDGTATREAYRDAIEDSGPDDICELRRALTADDARLSLQQCLALLRLTRFDPRVLGDLLETLWTHLPDAPAPGREDLRRSAVRAADQYYHLGESRDLPFDFGLLLYGLRAYDDALTQFERSLVHYGDDARTHWNIGLCHLALGRAARAAEPLARAVAMGLEPTDALRPKT